MSLKVTPSYSSCTHFYNHFSCRPEIFKPGAIDDSNQNLHGNTSQQETEKDSSDEDDGLPPLEANTNRMRPFELQTDEDSESSSDTDAWIIQVDPNTFLLMITLVFDWHGRYVEEEWRMVLSYWRADSAECSPTCEIQFVLKISIFDYYQRYKISFDQVALWSQFWALATNY